MNLGVIGLIVNPAAGAGAERNLDLACAALDSLEWNTVLAGPDLFGGHAAPEAQLIPSPGLRGRAASQWLARQMTAAGAEMLVVVGGDGTMTDVAAALAAVDSHVPILGIGAGSTNAGDLITCRGDSIDLLRDAQFAVQTLDALVASCNGEELGLAFNDVVIGVTVVGTLGGRVCDLDAVAFHAGERRVGRPQPVGAARALVKKQFRDRLVTIAQGEEIGTVIAGFAHHECFYGKAIVGGVCLTDLVGLPAGCLVSTQPLVRTQMAQDELAAVEPIRSAYVSLGEDEQIEVTGLGSPAMLCADGNPLAALAFDDVVQIRVGRQAARVVRMVTEAA